MVLLKNDEIVEKFMEVHKKNKLKDKIKNFDVRFWLCCQSAAMIDQRCINAFIFVKNKKYKPFQQSSFN